MADDLKRVGLVFKEDGAVDFKKTLQEVNLELNKNYNQFKLTQAQWDHSTKSTEKLREEQEYLKNAYEIQTDKINTLKMQLSDLENAETKNTTAIKKKRNELTSAEIKLETYNKRIKEIESQLKNTGKAIEEFGTKVQNSGKKIEEAGKKVSAFSLATGTALLTSAKTAIDFEDAFTGVEKTVDGTAEQMEELKQGIRNMAKEIPSTTTEISAVAEAAGQLGIQTENILDFSKAMIDLGNSTNLTADEAASQLAKFANIMQMSQKDFSKLGSSIVDLGNHFATTEADIVSMAMRLAGAGKQVGFSEGQVLGLATALSSVGIEAEMGGSAISKAMVKMQNAVEQGGTKLNTVLKKTGMTLRDLELLSANNSKDFKALANSIGMTSTEVKQLITAGTNLEDFAKVSGMSAKEFQKAWKEDASGALSAFIKGLGDAESKGESAITMLSEMGLTEVRLRDSLLRAANAGNLFNDAIETGTKAWEDNTALTNEANKRYDTLKSKITMTINKLKDQAITLGNKLMPSLEKTIEGFGKWIEKFENLSDEQVDMIVKIGLMVTALSPLLSILGKLTSTIGGVAKGIGTFVQAIGVLKGTISTTSTAVNGLASVIGGITSPTGIALTAVTLLAGGITYLALKQTDAQKEAKAFAEEMNNQKQVLEDYNKSIDEVTNSNLAQINSVDKLKDELSTLINENGKVKEGYESRVSFILNELNKALGTEYKLNGNIVESYQKLRDEIDETIKKKKAEIILNAEEEKYANAIKNQEEAVEDLKKAHENLGISIDEAKQKYNSWFSNYQEKLKNGNISTEDIFEVKEMNALKDLINAYDDAEYRVKEYTNETKKYKEDYALFIEGKYDEIGKTITKSTQEWCDSTIEEIKNSIDEQSKALNTYKQIYEDTGNEVALQSAEQAQKNLEELTKELISRTSTVDSLGKDEIQAWKELATNSYSIYYDTISKLPVELSSKIQEMTKVTAERTPELVDETQKMSQSVLEQIEKSQEFRTEAINNLRGMLDGLQDTELRELLENAGVEDIEKVMQGIRNGNLAEDEGLGILKSLHTGLNNTSWRNNLWNTAREIATKLSGILTVKANVNGNTSALPGHKLGLDYVPKDNYVARLHKGERVLTKEENEAYTSAEKRNSSNNTSFFSQGIDYNKMAKAITNALTNCKFALDEEGFARIVKDELYKVV